MGSMMIKENTMQTFRIHFTTSTGLEDFADYLAVSRLVAEDLFYEDFGGAASIDLVQYL
jgi:hypothetical protein